MSYSFLDFQRDEQQDLALTRSLDDFRFQTELLSKRDSSGGDCKMTRYCELKRESEQLAFTLPIYEEILTHAKREYEYLTQFLANESVQQRAVDAYELTPDFDVSQEWLAISLQAFQRLPQEKKMMIQFVQGTVDHQLAQQKLVQTELVQLIKLLKRRGIVPDEIDLD